MCIVGYNYVSSRLQHDTPGDEEALVSLTVVCVASQRSNKIVVVLPAGAVQNEVLPGFEPGSLDSESRVLTITP